MVTQYTLAEVIKKKKKSKTLSLGMKTNSNGTLSKLIEKPYFSHITLFTIHFGHEIKPCKKNLSDVQFHMHVLISFKTLLYYDNRNIICTTFDNGMREKNTLLLCVDERYGYSTLGITKCSKRQGKTHVFLQLVILQVE